MRRLALFLPLILFAGLGLLLWRGLSLDPNYMPAALEGRPLPAFDLRTLDGARVTEADLRGQPALLNVWATWCPSCAIEHGYLMRLAQAGTVIFAVNYKDDDAAARRWIAQKGNPYRLTIVDPLGHLGLDLGVTGAPETYVIDAAGVVRMRYQGPVDEQVWREKLQPLLASLATGGAP